MTNADLVNVEIRYSKPELYKRALFFGTILMFFLWIPYRELGERTSAMGFVAICTVAILAILSFGKLIGADKPALIITQDGFFYPKHIGNLIPWSDVASSRLVRVGQAGKALAIELRPSDASQWEWKGLARWTHRLFVSTHNLLLDPWEFDIEPERLVSIITAHVERAKKGRR